MAGNCSRSAQIRFTSLISDILSGAAVFPGLGNSLPEPKKPLFYSIEHLFFLR